MSGTNRLGDATSPYLQQHAHQPVHWWPWGPEAFEQARQQQRPIFLSVGYAACHWCHVMAHESFDDPAIAELLNRDFVAIKVDREEHPDVDAAYMLATQAMTGQGGWPMSVFLTPDGAPFFAGTYFPPAPTGGQPGFAEVLQALAQAWHERHDEVVESAAQIRAHVEQLTPEVVSADPPSLAAVQEQLEDQFDLVHAGWGRAPKFPAASLIDALLVRGDPVGLDLAQRTGEAMARGGICDQVGGGFHRYSTDAGWVLPHFEKMLYDNALLLGTYTRLWCRTADHDHGRRQLFERVVYRLVDWLAAEMRTEQGGFAASLDADSTDIRGMAGEGLFYLWNPELLTDALGEDDGQWAAGVFHVTRGQGPDGLEGGTAGHGYSTLQLRRVDDWERLDRVLHRLASVRAGRFRPARDDKVVAAWNGLLVDSLTRAAMVFGRTDWLDLALGAAQAVWSTHVVTTDDGAEPLLRRTSRDGRPGTTDGVTEDYAALALGFTTLAGATGDPVWLDRASWLLDRAEALFAAPDGGFFDAAPDQLRFTRPRELTDGATPSATALMAAALRATGLLAGREDLVQRADVVAATTWATVAELPRHSGASLTLAAIADQARKGLGPAEVAIVLPARPESDEAATGGIERLVQAAWRMAPAGSVVVSAPSGTTGFGHLFEQRPCVKVDGQPVPTAYVCHGRVCLEPVTEWSGLKRVLWQRV